MSLSKHTPRSDTASVRHKPYPDERERKRLQNKGYSPRMKPRHQVVSFTHSSKFDECLIDSRGPPPHGIDGRMPARDRLAHRHSMPDPRASPSRSSSGTRVRSSRSMTTREHPFSTARIDQKQHRNVLPANPWLDPPALRDSSPAPGNGMQDATLDPLRAWNKDPTTRPSPQDARERPRARSGRHEIETNLSSNTRRSRGPKTRKTASQLGLRAEHLCDFSPKSLRAPRPAPGAGCSP